MLTSRLPFHIGFKVPFEMTYGDTLRVPVALVNESLDDVSAQLHVSQLDECLQVTDPKGCGVRLLDLAAGQRARHVVGMAVRAHNGRDERWRERARVCISAVTDDLEHEDVLTQRTRIAPAGFPSTWSSAGCLMSGRTSTLSLSVPPLSSAGVQTVVCVHASPASTLEEALDGLASMPCGCFEQRCSAMWPAVLLLQRAAGGTAMMPQLLRRPHAIVAKGVSGLAQFEVRNADGTEGGGFDWFVSQRMSARPELSAYGCLFLQKVCSLGLLPAGGPKPLSLALIPCRLP